MLERLSVDAKRTCQWTQAAVETLADGLEFPFAAVAVDFAKDHRRFGRAVFGQVVAGDFAFALRVQAADVGFRDHAEILAARVGVVYGHGDADAVDVGWYARQVDFDALIVAFAFAGLVVARVDDGAIGRFQ